MSPGSQGENCGMRVGIDSGETYPLNYQPQAVRLCGDVIFSWLHTLDTVGNTVNYEAWNFDGWERWCMRESDVNGRSKTCTHTT